MPDGLANATLARLREHMEEGSWNWLALGSPANVAYSTGYRSVAGDIFASHQMAVLVSQTEVILVAPAADFGAAAEHLAPNHIEPFGTFFFDSVNEDPVISEVADRNGSFTDAFESAIRRFAVAGLVGFDAGIDERTAARAGGVSGLRLGNIDSWMSKVRSIKLSGEVDRLTKAARLADEGIRVALATAYAGVSENELAAIVGKTMVEGGGTPRFVVVTSGERSALSDARPTDRIWQWGELLRFDVGCTYAGYWSDIGRTAVLGEPSDLQARRYEAIKAGEDSQLRAAAPGKLASELFATAVETVQSAGLRPYRRHHCGHGIGRDVYEPPIVAPRTETPLQEAMVLCFETPFYEIGWGGMMVEDTVVITGDGSQRLNRSDRNLRVVEA